MQNLQEVLQSLGPKTSTTPKTSKRTIEIVTFEHDYAIALPDDLKELIQIAGAFTVDRFLTVFCPGEDNPHVDLRIQFKQRLEAQEQFNRTFSGAFPFPLFPAPHGLFPWGCTANGDVLYCNAKNLDVSIVVVCSDRSEEYAQFPKTVRSFLEEVLSASLKCKIFPATFPSSNPIISLA